MTWNDRKPLITVASISGFPISGKQDLFRPGRPIKNFNPFMEVNKERNSLQVRVFVNVLIKKKTEVGLALGKN